MFFSRSQARIFDELVRPHMRSLYRLAHRLTGNPADAEDLVQDVMVKLYPRTQELQSVDDLRPWLNRVLYRQFVDRDRRGKRRREQALSDMGTLDNHQEFLDGYPGSSLEPLAEMERGQAGRLVQEALAELSPDQRALLILYDVEGWEQQAIAAVLDVAPGTVKSRLHRCRQKLREILAKRMEP
ncbi:RNA polymerase sigma factor [Halomonadaceae bacterium KBTZ08]